jgi:hypothetical protein
MWQAELCFDAEDGGDKFLNGLHGVISQGTVLFMFVVVVNST